MKTVALTGKVKFTANDKVQYRVETILDGRKSGWKQHYDTKEKAMAFIEREKTWHDSVGLSSSSLLTQYLVTEVTTKTLGLF